MFPCKGTQLWSYFDSLSLRIKFGSNGFFQIRGENTQAKDP